MRILLDAAFFPLSGPESGVGGRVMQGILAAAQAGDATVLVLDRGELPELEGAQVLEFPTYRRTKAATDSILVQRICDSLGADVFVSTGLTTPLTTPTVQVLIGKDLDEQAYACNGPGDIRECAIAIELAAFVVCLAPSMEHSLRARFPEMRACVCTSHAGDAHAIEEREDRPGERILDVCERIASLSREQGPCDWHSRWIDLRRVQAAVET